MKEQRWIKDPTEAAWGVQQFHVNICMSCEDFSGFLALIDKKIYLLQTEDGSLNITCKYVLGKC